MISTIHSSRYKDQPAITLESQTIAAQFLPGVGAKLCSLIYKPANLELLVQHPNEKYRLASYNGDYVEQGECSGFDEMFPSIDTCFYEGYPWRGTPVPDHGEVWSIPWVYTIVKQDPASGRERDSDRLHFAVHGVRFPYRLEKWISLIDGATLHADYRLTNLSNFDLDFMWAAHMMLNLEEDAELALPDGVRKIVTALSFDGSLGRYGDEFDWPVATLSDGRKRDLRRMQPKAANDVVKYFVKGRIPEGWCMLTYPQSGCELRLIWPAEQVPYLAVLPDQGGWQDLYSIFLEPATASFDRLDLARVRGECSTVRGGAVYEWYLDIQLG
ncbi:MAG: hypothetical protein J5I90_20910 [Caldilineales bacterium]|nr:hypothetical protein [Caldilineales bacterium]